MQKYQFPYQTPYKKLKLKDFKAIIFRNNNNQLKFKITNFPLLQLLMNKINHTVHLV
jgi:hypothetical protein